jgi:hypothetical protein
MINLKLTPTARALMAADIIGNPLAGVPTPSLDLDFVNSSTLDSRITFTRASGATYFDSSGVLQTAASGVARFDHNPITGESLGLLVEEQRTNICLQSEDFSTTWTAVNASAQTNVAIAPTGALTADKLTEDTSSGVSHRITQTSMSLAASTAATFSFYAKASGRNIVRAQLYEDNSNGILTGFFDLSSGTVTSTSVSGTASGASGTITAVGNGWYRCTLSGIPYTSGTLASVALTLVSTGTTVVYTGDGYSGVFLWGAQLEVGAFPTSYIPTVAATVTRNADAASMTGANFSSWYRADEGTVYVESQKNYSGSTRFPVLTCISDGTSNNLIESFWTDSSSSLQIAVYVNNTGVAFPGTSSLTQTNAYKQSFVYKVNDFANVINGATAVTDTSGGIPVVDRLTIGSRNNSSVLNGTIKKIAFYPTRATNAQLQALTTV